MEQIQYKGSIMSEIHTLISKYPDYTFGEILHSFLRQSVLGEKSYYNVTDEEFLITLENLNGKDIETDTILTDDEFKDWRNGK